MLNEIGQRREHRPLDFESVGIFEIYLVLLRLAFIAVSYFERPLKVLLFNLRKKVQNVLACRKPLLAAQNRPLLGGLEQSSDQEQQYFDFHRGVFLTVG